MAKPDFKDDRANAERRAKTLGLLTFGFLTLVSTVIALTEDSLDAIDILLMLGMPPVLGTLAYFVGLYQREDRDGSGRPEK